MYWTVLVVLSTVLSTVAVVLAVVIAERHRRIMAFVSFPFDQLERLEARIDDADVQLAQHHERIRRINARMAARDRRSLAEKGTDADEQEELPLTTATGVQLGRSPGESELEWKRRMRAAIATGAIKHG